MGGGSSKSSTSSSTQSMQSAIEGLNTGEVNVAGGNITVNKDFPEEVQKTFENVLGIVSKLIDVSAGAGEAALTAVQQRYERQEQPAESLARDYMPLFALASGGVVLYLLVK